MDRVWLLKRAVFGCQGPCLAGKGWVRRLRTMPGGYWPFFGAYKNTVLCPLRAVFGGFIRTVPSALKKAVFGGYDMDLDWL